MKENIMTLKIDGKEIEEKINQLISQGWIVEDIKKTEYYKVRFSKFSGLPIKKPEKRSKIPILKFLSRPMIVTLCRCFEIKYSKIDTCELIDALEKYKREVVMIAYHSITEENKKKKKPLLNKKYETNKI